MSQPFSNDQAFIAKLKGILEENFHKETFGVTELALAMGISRSQLHRKLHQIKNTSASEFIKAFRLEKAHALLKDDVSTVSEIAYAVGFGSPSYFSKCFQERYKYSPTEIKAKQNNNNESNEESNKSSRSSSDKKIKNKWVIIGGVLTLVLVILISFTISSSSAKKTDLITIGVLPFKNLSDDTENQYFADGVMEEILNHLSRLDSLKVISRTTMENYPEAIKTVPEIASKLNMTHVIEASVQKHDNRVRIVIQLIDAQNDKHLWAESYDRDYQDIFALQSDIAKEVARQLERELTVSSIAKLEEALAENVEAYNLYLKGRFFWLRRTKEDLEKSIHYFEEALRLDSTYALAYAGLAEAYVALPHHGDWGDKHDLQDKEDTFEKGNYYAEKALEINPQMASAYTAIGSYYASYKRNWKQAESALKKALEIDVNHANAHQQYATWLDILRRRDEAREHINLALKINPVAPIALQMSALLYYHDGNFNNAIEEMDKAVEIRNKPWNTLYIRSHLRLGEEDKALKRFKILMERTSVNQVMVDSIYRQRGIQEVLNQYIDSMYVPKKVMQYYEGAAINGLLGNKQKELELLEKSFESGEFIMDRINANPDFDSIRSDPRFVALLKKINLKD
ncbi:helix-turn-helix domain-containing protein [Seonamhaeicola aphaedonensis]|uniref:TolB-like protein n=1 Tax=Seonamhaeicola aphaedonensis TaxID=1461338 RepID=A0A3D9H5L9_9FLAO|nr:helix-turn-helix domain-containing protein [Seonamhaeicola aphaedonensis]RED44732.1 TolB-like protein [Seonamhaeicola aphaedonensis]